MSVFNHLKNLQKKSGKEAQRLFAELRFASEYDRSFQTGFEKDIEKISAQLAAREHITAADVEEAEQALLPLSRKIKQLTVLAVAHAHLDMNWMWRYDETVNITLSTFRSVLDFMKEYPDLTFGQSQASVYEIVEKYDPDMLREIRQRVKEGRWQPVVSTWTEPDKNMPSGETLARHLLYSKRYISGLLDYPADKLDIDFEPDTFGHNADIPQILSQGGVRYYYHCRGYEGHHIYRWRKGNSEVLVHREPVWYNAEITYNDLSYMPQFAKDNRIDTLLMVYGVGNHGGGPTRRDLTRLTEMMTWPLLPTIRFGTYAQYFASLESKREQFPVVEGELNNFAAGCYTTQTRIKRMNKTCENQLYEAEFFNTVSHFLGGYAYDAHKFEEAWRKVLFNNFHDILPGSGTADTREHALGNYQECLAVTSSRKNLALRSLAQRIDTSAYLTPVDEDSLSEGAGGGFDHLSGHFAAADRGNGKQRLFHLFNSAAYDSDTPQTVTVWDYPDDIRETQFFCNDRPVTAQLLDAEPVFYWGHFYQRFAVDVPVKAFGYATVLLRPKTEGTFSFPFPDFPRLDSRDGFELENQYLKAVFDTQTCSLLRLTDKTDGTEVIDAPAAFFRLLSEDASKEMTAWMIGRYNKMQDLMQNVVVSPQKYVKGPLVQSLSYEIPFGHSRLFVTVSLANHAKALTYTCRCDFRETAVPHVSVPNLSLCIPCKPTGNYLSGIAFGRCERPLGDYDMPTVKGVFVPTEKKGIGIVSNSKYGFRVTEDLLQMTVVRNSYEPDPLPDFGMTEFDFALTVCDGYDDVERLATRHAHPVSTLSCAPSAGDLPQNGQFLEVQGACVSCIKTSEDGKGLIVRLYDAGSDVTIRSFIGITAAFLCDLRENVLSPLAVTDDTVFLPATKDIITVKIQ